MSNPVTAVTTLALITATSDGTPLAVLKTRLLQTAGVPTIALADGYEASDIDCFKEAPFDGHHGLTCTAYMQQTADWCIPDALWIEHYKLLCLSIQVASMSRHKVTCEPFSIELGELPCNPGMVSVALCLPNYTHPSETTMNGKPLGEELSRSNSINITGMNRND